MTDPGLLRVHGDTAARPGDLDFAVNVRSAGPPGWLADQLAAGIADLGRYPSAADDAAARRAVAAGHGIDPARVLPLSGASEGFALLARLAARRGLDAACVHPSYTEPELELRAAGVEVHRVVLPEPFELDPQLVPAGAGMVVVGNPTNPTSVSHPREHIAELCRPGRITVVDEAFADMLADEPAVTLVGSDLPGLVVVRSLTKTWGLAGLRVGYLVAAPELAGELSALRPHWPLGTLALRAIEATASPQARDDLARIRREAAGQVAAMRTLLAEAGVEVVGDPAGPFLLLRLPPTAAPDAFRAGLSALGIAVRRCDTFPGLGPEFIRVAARPEPDARALVAAWKHLRTKGER